MDYLHKEFDLGEGDGVEVTLAGNAANVMLLDDVNFQNYTQRKPYKYYGGYARTSPFRIQAPHPGAGIWLSIWAEARAVFRPRAGSSARPSHKGAPLAARKKNEEQVVRVAPLGELRAYTISEHELEKLERGTPVSDLLTIGLCLLSAAVTILATILSTTLSAQTFTLFFFLALLIVGLGGAICTYLGWRWRTSTRELVSQIRARMPDVPSIQQIVAEPSASPLGSPPEAS